MSQCDLCGKDNAATKAKIEGTILRVCTVCAAFGEIIKPDFRPQTTNYRPSTTDLKPQTSDLKMITPDYAQKIKTAREKAGLTQEDVAQKINEKVTLIQKVEAGNPPSMALAKKLEHFFAVQLIIPYAEEQLQKTEKTAELTIGDILSTKKDFPKRKAS